MVLERSSTDNINQRMQMAARKLGLRVEHGYAKHGSQLVISLGKISEDTWYGGGNRIPFNHFQRSLNNPNLILFVGYAEDGKQEHPCCLLGCHLAGRDRSQRSQSPPQSAVIALLWTQLEYRRKRYAAFLIDSFSPFLIDGTFLQSGSHDHPPALALYHNNGFDRNGETTTNTIAANQLRSDAKNRLTISITNAALKMRKEIEKNHSEQYEFSVDLTDGAMDTSQKGGNSTQSPSDDEISVPAKRPRYRSSSQFNRKRNHSEENALTVGTRPRRTRSHHSNTITCISQKIHQPDLLKDLGDKAWGRSLRRLGWEGADGVTLTSDTKVNAKVLFARSIKKALHCFGASRISGDWWRLMVTANMCQKNHNII
jgi:hypothetical protein